MSVISFKGWEQVKHNHVMARMSRYGNQELMHVDEGSVREQC